MRFWRGPMRADIEEIAELCRFRRGRYKSWQCGFHDDRTPSASIRGRRIRCFGECSRSWDVFELIEQAHGVDFRGVLSYPADHYGVTINRPLTRVERTEYARRRDAARLLFSVGYAAVRIGSVPICRAWAR